MSSFTSVRHVRVGTGTASRAVSSTTSAELLAANGQREGLTVFNDDANTLYLLFADGTASATNYTGVPAPINMFMKIAIVIVALLVTLQQFGVLSTTGV